MYISFLKYVLGVNKKACNIAVLSEIGQYPYTLKILTRACKNWYRIKNTTPESLLYDAYLCNTKLPTGKSFWIQSLSNTFSIIGCDDILKNGGDEFGDFCPKVIQHLLEVRFLIQWQNTMELQLLPDKKLRTYATFKTKFDLEPYLLIMNDYNSRKNFTRLRISAHNLNIELGRHRRPNKIPIEDRICDTCNSIEDEIHYLLFCQRFSSQREILMSNISKFIVDFETLNSGDKFNLLMKCDDYEITLLVKKFVDYTVGIRGPL